MNTDASLRYVQTAIRALPGELAAALQTSLPQLSQRPSSVLTTGIGGSEGPARILASVLDAAGLPARFCPVSSFQVAPPRAELLVVFSQGLSPNARLTLCGQACCPQRWLVTSVVPGAVSDGALSALDAFRDAGFVPISAPPLHEERTLVRLVGPTVGALLALRLAAQLLGDARLAALTQRAPEAYAHRMLPRALDDAPLALITVGDAGATAFAHRWKLLEALWTCDPPVWDVLQFAHGPLQSFYARRLTLITLEVGSPSPLVERLARTLVPERHLLLRLVSQQPDELAFFEHAACLDALIAATLAKSPRDLFHWPAQNCDGPLYGVGKP